MLLAAGVKNARWVLVARVGMVVDGGRRGRSEWSKEGGKVGGTRGRVAKGSSVSRKSDDDEVAGVRGRRFMSEQEEWWRFGGRWGRNARTAL